MPVLGYFLVVGGVLTALLFAADAFMVRPEKVSFASNFDGLPAEYKGEPNTRRPFESPPALASLAPVAETTGSASPREEPAAAQEPAKAKPQRKVVHRRQRQDGDDWSGGNNRRDFAFGQRDSFGSSYREPSYREPSWRDSWAASSFDQPRERGSRRASRQNNEFWFR